MPVEFATLIYFIDLIFALLVIFFQRKKPTSTLLWVMIIMTFPIGGFLFYLIIGADYRKSKRFVSKDEVEFKYQKVSEDQRRRLKSGESFFTGTPYETYNDLMRMNLMNSDAFLTQGNDVRLFTDGTKKFDTLIRDIRSAKKSVYLEYYIFKGDDFGYRLLQELTRCAERGVEVRLLVDGMGGRTLPRKWVKTFEAAGGHFGVFFPLSARFFIFRLNYRNHRKIAVIDGRIGYVGGFNVGEEYVNRSSFGFWDDRHLRIEGNGAIGLLWRFYLDWKFAVEEEIALPDFSEPLTGGASAVQIISSGPDSKWPANKDAYIQMMSEAKRRIYIQTPYFIPDSSVYDTIRVAALSGVDVRIMIPSKRDHPLVYWAGMSYLGELLDCGVRVYEYFDGFLHAKCVLIDDAVVSIGTTNMDIRSFVLNFEVNAMVYDEKLNERIAREFKEDMVRSVRWTKEKYGRRSVRFRLMESFSRLFSPLL